LYAGRIQIPETRPEFNMVDAPRIDVHETAAGGVGGNGIVGEYDATEVFHWSVQRSVAFHGLNTVGNNEVDRDRGSDLTSGSRITRFRLAGRNGRDRFSAQRRKQGKNETM